MSKTFERAFERVRFTMIHTPCCHTVLCYVNSRMPNYCSECGARLFGMKCNPENILFTDDNAQLKYTEPDTTIILKARGVKV